ncbi:DUF2157 domain-containing protein [Halobacillus yeomjeoni]|uniref:DUF2157 domain-containing protein n=1 Tax=Halobacillus yeomjeoni TaxID=311194 RepID=A0A931MTV2_9BACI|nr:DUF2157 domain-containing protein [Halobacillus yeomjeoni]MBH0228749.1 DUF2157 domain-containing protein [Halobacillus yeomjeoni]
MNRAQVVKESQKWVEEQIISEHQREQLIERYPKRQNKPLLFTFAAIFIGLGFLTFIASNWSFMPDLVKMAVILVSMLGFYAAGEQVYRKQSQRLGLSFILIALLIFGSGIFLTGQMYHFTSYSAFPFLIWSLAGYGIYLVFRDHILFITTVILLTIGQIYSGVVFQEYHFWLGLLFILGIGWVAYSKKDLWLTLVFGISYSIQSLVFVLNENLPYYWLIVLCLILYLLDDLLADRGQIRVLKTMAVVSVLIVNGFQVILLGVDELFLEAESTFAFFIIWAVLFVLTVIRSALSSTNHYWIDLILFVPVFKFGFGDALSLLILFAYSLLWLVSGYQTETVRWVNKGTAAFILTTFLAYFQLAWDFMNRSLFFFIGGILLFMMSFFLERKRRKIHKGGGE